MQLQDAMNDPQPQPAIAPRTTNVERPQEQPFTQLRGNPRPCIADGHFDIRPLRAQAKFDFSTLRRMTQSVVEQVGQHPLNQSQIGAGR
ncbi:hypothetical protein D3C71_1960100 [compost metagenome]